jgi:hypothetical protein
MITALIPLLEFRFAHLLKMVWILIAYWKIYGKDEDPFVFFLCSGPRKQINLQSCLPFCLPSALHQKSHIDNMIHLARLGGEQKFCTIYAYLFISATLAR